MTNKRKHLIVGTRGSALALRQTEMVVDQLRQVHPDVEFAVEVRRISTEGDRQSTVPLEQIAGRGVFVKDLEIALLAEEIDLAVHSLKDMTSVTTPGLTIAAVSEREDPRDVVVSKNGYSISTLPQGAALGTSSIRRAAQLLAVRPDLKIKPMRGNVDTRLRKAAEGEYDAVVLAAAGVIRLDRGHEITQYIPYDICLPAVGQGVMAVETRSNDKEVIALVSAIDHAEVHRAITAERVFLHKLGGGCLVPIAAMGTVTGGVLDLVGMICSPDGRKLVRDSVRGDVADPQTLGNSLAEKLRQEGAEEVLAEYRAALPS